MGIRTILLLSLLLWGWAASSLGACPPLPGNVVFPAAARMPVDLIHELEQPWQAGGGLVVFCGPDGAPRAGRRLDPPSSLAEEVARRAEQFALARLVNFARKGGRLPPLSRDQVELLDRFARSDAGAVWMREVADDTLRLLNLGYLEYDKTLWKAAVKSGRMPALSRLLTGVLSEKGQFAQDAQVFRIHAYAGPGAMAQPGAIGLGDAGMRCQFPTSKELVDPHAVLSHEFGHTRYGDPDSAGSLLGEARTVERYENPVRVRNGYEPRTVYFQRTSQGLEPRKDSLIDRVLRLEKEKGISVEDRSPVDRYHCDCPGPLPVILDCEVRQRQPGDNPLEPASEHDCKLNWRPPTAPEALRKLVEPKP